MTLRKVWAFVRLTRPLFLFGGVVLNLLGLAVARRTAIRSMRGARCWGKF